MQYKVNDLDFSSLLQEELDKDTSSENQCLISKLPLDETKIILECGHAFNYFPIYKEIIKFSSLKRKF